MRCRVPAAQNVRLVLKHAQELLQHCPVRLRIFCSRQQIHSCAKICFQSVDAALGALAFDFGDVLVGAQEVERTSTAEIRRVDGRCLLLSKLAQKGVEAEVRAGEALDQGEAVEFG